jgi:hypothetical protein
MHARLRPFLSQYKENVFWIDPYGPYLMKAPALMVYLVSAVSPDGVGWVCGLAGHGGHLEGRKVFGDFRCLSDGVSWLEFA